MLPNIATLDSYGGAKANYGGVAVVDPTTDEDAASRNEYVTDTAAMTHTAPRAMRSFMGVDAGNPNDPPSGFVHDSIWGNAPAMKPGCVRFSEGAVDITWPASVNTELAIYPEVLGGGSRATAIPLNFRRALAQIESPDGTLCMAHAKVTGANSVRVYTYLGTTLDDCPGRVVTVWVW